MSAPAPFVSNIARLAGPARVVLDAAAGLCGGTAEEAARGVALGVWFGLVPKENATAAALGVAVAAVRLNLPAAALAATAATALAPLYDPALHRFGLALLTAEPLRGTFAAALALPGGAWLGWDNTVTLAALLVGGAAALPLHRATLSLHRMFAGPVAAWWAGTRWGRALGFVHAAGRLAKDHP